MRFLIFTLIFHACLSVPLHAAPALEGRAYVHDGDTIRIGGTSVRLWGIDAMELKQTCRKGGDTLPCGAQARAALKDFVRGKDVTCAPRGRSYKRVVATCRVGRQDIGAWMVRSGMAVEAVKYSRGRYSVDEIAAREDRLGIWGMEAEDPAYWRACHLRPARGGAVRCAGAF